MQKILTTGTAVGALMLSASFAASAELDLSDLNGDMLSPEVYAELVADAAKASPPNDGSTLTIGFANLSRDIVFTQLVEKSILENAERAGIKVIGSASG